MRLTDRTREELEAPVATFAELLELLGYSTAETQAVRGAPTQRLVESSYEVRDYWMRAMRTLRYRWRLPRRFTTIGT